MEDAATAYHLFTHVSQFRTTSPVKDFLGFTGHMSTKQAPQASVPNENP